MRRGAFEFVGEAEAVRVARNVSDVVPAGLTGTTQRADGLVHVILVKMEFNEDVRLDLNLFWLGDGLARAVVKGTTRIETEFVKLN